jgi:tetratricopeptide (TPR) repeat protein
MSRIAVLALLVFSAAAQGPSPQLLLKQAVEEHQAGHLDDAVRDYRELLNRYPQIAQVRSNLGAALAAQGKYTDAIAEYKRALLAREDTQVRANLALAYYKSAQLPLAIAELETVLKAEPGNQKALLLLGDCYLTGGNNKKVIELLSPLADAGTRDLAVTYMLGTALVRNGDTAKGQVIIDRILKDGDSAEARLLLGTTKLYANDYAGARDDLARAVALKPDLPDVYSYYGTALLATGDPDGSRSAFEQELKRNPNSFDANLRMGILARQDQDNERAMQFFQQAANIRPDDLGVRYQIATAELALNRVDQAQQHLEALLREAPQFTEAHVTLATVYYREKRKADGDRERATAQKQQAERQAKEPGVKSTQ